MKVAWIILAVMSFLGGQAYLFYLLRKLDKYLENRSENESSLVADDDCGNPDGTVIE